MKYIILIIFITICLSIDIKQVINLTESTNDRTIHINNKDEINFILVGNISTGYKWYLREFDKIDDSFLKFIELENEESKGYRSTKNYETIANSNDIETYNMENLPKLGLPGKYTFKAIPQNKKGEMTLKFIYLRSWEDESKNNDSIKLSINLIFSSTNNDILINNNNQTAEASNPNNNNTNSSNNIIDISSVSYHIFFSLKILFLFIALI